MELKERLVDEEMSIDKRLSALDAFEDIGGEQAGNILLQVASSNQLEASLVSKCFNVLLSLSKSQQKVRRVVFDEFQNRIPTIKHVVLIGEIASDSPSSRPIFKKTLIRFLENPLAYSGENRGLGRLGNLASRDLIGDASPQLLGSLIKWPYFKHRFDSEPILGGGHWAPDTSGSVDLDMAKTLSKLASLTIAECKDLLIAHADQVLKDLEDGVVSHGKVYESGNDEYSDEVQISYVSFGSYIREFSSILPIANRETIADKCDELRAKLGDLPVSDLEKDHVRMLAIKELEETSRALRQSR